MSGGHGAIAPCRSRRSNRSVMRLPLKTRIFVALVEVRPRPDCEILDPSDVAGAAVRCYIAADRVATARRRLEAHLRHHALEHIETEWLVRQDQVEWESPDDPDARRLTDEAAGSGGVAFGEFHVWGHDAKD